MTAIHPLSANLNREFHIQRHQYGMCLVEPDAMQMCSLPLSQLLDSSLSTYFMDTDSYGVAVNEACAELNSASSISELVYKKSSDYYQRATALRHFAEDRMVLGTKSLHVAGDHAAQITGKIVDIINIKLPWYKDNDIIGVCGLTLKIDANNMQQLSQNLNLLLSSGIFLPQQVSHLSSCLSVSNSKIYFTPREKDVLLLLLRGHTSKKIGNILRISSRTVEHIVARLKDKTQCTTKFELIEKYRQSS